MSERKNRDARTQIAALSATVRAQNPARRARIVAHLRHASRLLSKAERPGGPFPFYVGLADDTLRGIAGQIRSRPLARRVHEIRRLLIGHRGDPPQVRIGSAAARVEGGAASVRLRCPAEATGPCTGRVRLLQRGRPIGGRHFTLPAGRARTLRIALSRAPLGRRATVRATTTDLSGRRTVAARRIALPGAPADQTTGACSSFAC